MDQDYVRLRKAFFETSSPQARELLFAKIKQTKEAMSRKEHPVIQWLKDEFPRKDPENDVRVYRGMVERTMINLGHNPTRNPISLDADWRYRLAQRGFLGLLDLLEGKLHTFCASLDMKTQQSILKKVLVILLSDTSPEESLNAVIELLKESHVCDVNRADVDAAIRRKIQTQLDARFGHYRFIFGEGSLVLSVIREHQNRAHERVQDGWSVARSNAIEHHMCKQSLQNLVHILHDLEWDVLNAFLVRGIVDPENRLVHLSDLFPGSKHAKVYWDVMEANRALDDCEIRNGDREDLHDMPAPYQPSKRTPSTDQTPMRWGRK